MKTLLLLLSLLLSLTALTADEELLRPEDAFRLQASALDADTVRFNWDIARGYYLYRHRFSFTTDTPGYALGEAEIPDGKLKHDDIFGDVETYRDRIEIDVPVTRTDSAADSLVIKAVSQGCADAGVCYPPYSEEVSITLPERMAGNNVYIQKTGGVLSGLKSLVGSGDASSDEPLHPDDAFELSVQADSPTQLTAMWRIADGYYLYRDKMQFSLQDTDSVSLARIDLPAGRLIEDEYYGEMQIYEGNVLIPVGLQRQSTEAESIVLQITYQGCAVDGICYPPISKQIPVQLAAIDSVEQLAGENTGSSNPAAPPATNYQSEQDRITGTLEQGRVWLIVASFFGFGLLLAFTPCVFPMIPILSGILAGQGTSLTTIKAFSLSMVYVLAMAVTYTMVGIAVGLSGENLQIWFQNSWVLSAFAGIMVLLALAMFGFYELQMPSGIQTRLNALSNRQEGGTLIGAGIMGFLSALIVGPCVTAPLIGALVYIANTGNAVLGGIALFALSLGMGAPLLLIGASAGKFLPKAGPWMEAVKAVFGVLLLALAIWFLERILPISVIMVLSAVLLIVSAIYMGALDSLREKTSGWFRLWKGVGLVMFVYGALLLVGAAGGGSSLLQPLNGLTFQSASQSAHDSGLKFSQIKGLNGLEQALTQARASGQPVILDFYADWCISCKEMEKYTFTDTAVQNALKGFIKLQADVTANDAQDKELLKQLGLFGPPAILFYTPEGVELKNYRVVGFMSAEKFSSHIHQAFSDTLAASL